MIVENKSKVHKKPVSSLLYRPSLLYMGGTQVVIYFRTSWSNAKCTQLGRNYLPSFLSLLFKNSPFTEENIANAK